jgi:xylulokinase
MAGATAPFVDVDARGSLVHLDPDTTQAHLVRAVLEGTSLAIRDCYQAMPVPVLEIRLTGGGARSASWSQIIADTLQKDIVVPDVPESGALGAAMLAGVAVARFGDLGEAAHSLVKEGRTHVPDPSLAPVYDAAFIEYRRLLEPLREIWARSARHIAHTNTEGASA